MEAMGSAIASTLHVSVGIADRGAISNLAGLFKIEGQS